MTEIPSSVRSTDRDRWIAWLFIIGSSLFAYRRAAMSGNAELSNLGTLVGALCFLTGAILMLSPASTDASVSPDRETHP
jgi:uncharacterized membrane protein YgdD (TMEM256/DUF423 family)